VSRKSACKDRSSLGSISRFVSARQLDLVYDRDRFKALIVANQFLETHLEKLRAAVSTGYARGKLFERAQ
jgi:hypothetical protein